MDRLLIHPSFQCQFVDMRKNLFVNEGELPDGESQIDFLSFGVVSPMGFSSPITNNRGFLHVHRTLGCSLKMRLISPYRKMWGSIFWFFKYVCSLICKCKLLYESTKSNPFYAILSWLVQEQTITSLNATKPNKHPTTENNTHDKV